MDNIGGRKGFFTKHLFKDHFIIFQFKCSCIGIDRGQPEASMVPFPETLTHYKIGLSESISFKGFEFENEVPIKIMCEIKPPQ